MSQSITLVNLNSLSLLKSSDSRLARNPLAVLLPRLGELTDLAGLNSMLEKRIAELQAAGSSEGDKYGEVERMSSEQAMLTQVMQWLSLKAE